MTFICGYGTRCVFHGRVRQKGQLCPDCLDKEVQESNDEIAVPT